MFFVVLERQKYRAKKHPIPEMCPKTNNNPGISRIFFSTPLSRLFNHHQNQQKRRQQEPPGCPRKLGSMVSKLVSYNLLINGDLWVGYKPLILTFDPSTSKQKHPSQLTQTDPRIAIAFHQLPTGSGAPGSVAFADTTTTRATHHLFWSPTERGRLDVFFLLSSLDVCFFVGCFYVLVGCFFVSSFWYVGLLVCCFFLFVVVVVVLLLLLLLFCLLFSLLFRVDGENVSRCLHPWS